MIETVPATADMLAGLVSTTKSVRAIAAVENGRVLGVAGIYVQGDGQVVFSRIGDDLKQKPKAMVLAWRKLLAMIKARRLPTFAKCDKSIPKAEEFLRHLGFVPVFGDVWRMP